MLDQASTGQASVRVSTCLAVRGMRLAWQQQYGKPGMGFTKVETHLVRAQECLEMRNIGSGTAGLPPAAALIQGPLVQRQARKWPQPSLWLRALCP